MRNAVIGSKFRRDVKLMQRRGKDMSKLRAMILDLIQELPLPPSIRDHPLSGDWTHHRDCHIEPYWIVIYKIDGADLFLVRTGSHADLF